MLGLAASKQSVASMLLSIFPSISKSSPFRGNLLFKHKGASAMDLSRGHQGFILNVPVMIASFCETDAQAPPDEACS